MPEDSVKLENPIPSPGTNDMPMQNFYQIAELNPYHKGWTIKARVTSRSETRTFTNTRSSMGGKGGGGGKVFSIDIVDKDNCEIRGTFYNQEVDKYDKIIEVGKVYTFSKGDVKVSNKQYSQVNHEYEITFRSDSKIVELNDDDEISKNTIYSFIDMNTAKNKSLPYNADFIGVIYDDSGAQPVRQWSKDGISYSKYVFNFADETGNAMQISIFGDAMIKKYPQKMIQKGAVVAMKGVTVKEFAGRSGILQTTGILEMNPLNGHDLTKQRTEELQSWWSKTGSIPGKMNFINMTDQSLLGSVGMNKTVPITLETLRSDVEMIDHEKPVYNDVYCYFAKCLTMSRDRGELPVYYEACTEKIVRDERETQCNKKCEGGHCPEHGMVKTQKRWMARTIWEDHSDSHLIQSFDSDFQALCGHTAEEQATQTPEGIPSNTIPGANISGGSETPLTRWIDTFAHSDLYKMRIRTNVNEYQGERRGQTRIVDLKKVDYVGYGFQLLNELKEGMEGVEGK